MQLCLALTPGDTSCEVVDSPYKSDNSDFHRNPAIDYLDNTNSSNSTNHSKNYDAARIC